MDVRVRIGCALLLAALLSTVPARGQDVTVTASVEETTVGAEETFAYTIEIKGASFGDVATPEAPETEGLVLLQTIPSTQRSVSFINGEMAQSIGFSWTFRPQREGDARIKAAEITVDGSTYRTEPIRLTVVPQSQRPRRSARRDPFNSPLFSDPFDQDDDPDEAPSIDPDDLFIRALPTENTVYQGEQIGVDYELYFRNGIQLRQSRLADSWDAEGFWREELDVEGRPIPRTEVRNGLRYNVVTLKRIAVFPTHAGPLRVDPLRIETEAFAPRRSNDPLGAFYSLRNRFTPVELASPEVQIEAKPLPEGAPASFRGAVGDFALDVRTSETDIEVGESIQVRVQVSGTGNIATLDAPTLRVPGIFERYDPDVDAQIDRSGRRVEGTKTFTYVLLPRSNGAFTLPPVEFSYFDPERERYETLRSEPIPITVTGTAGAAPATATAAGLPVDDIAGLMAEPTAWVRTGTTPLYQRWSSYLLLVVPLLALGALFVYRRRLTRLATDVGYARSRRAHPLAKKHLKRAEELLARGEARAFYEEIERAVLGYVGDRLNVAEKGLTRPRLDADLAGRGVPDQTRRDLLALLDESDRARFAPVPPPRAVMEDATDRAARLIVALEADLARQPAAA